MEAPTSTFCNPTLYVLHDFSQQKPYKYNALSYIHPDPPYDTKHGKLYK